MKKLLLILLCLPLIGFGQHIYKGRMFLGGMLKMKFEAESLTSFDNFPNEDNAINAIGHDFTLGFKYGYFLADHFAIGSELLGRSSNDFTGDGPELNDTAFMQKNTSNQFLIGPLLRYYFLIGEQPYEIGSIYIEAGYRFGIQSSRINSKFSTPSNVSSFSYREAYYMHEITTKVGYSLDLTNFIKHNWFVDVLALEPEIVWIQRKRDYQGNSTDYMNTSDQKTLWITSYIPLGFNIALNAYF